MMPSVVATMSTSNPVMNYYTFSQYYPDGNVRSVSDGYGTVLFNYDAAGNPVSIKNARGFATSFAYDKMGRVNLVLFLSQPTLDLLTGSPLLFCWYSSRHFSFLSHPRIN